MRNDFPKGARGTRSPPGIESIVSCGGVWNRRVKWTKTRKKKKKRAGSFFVTAPNVSLPRTIIDATAVVHVRGIAANRGSDKSPADARSRLFSCSLSAMMPTLTRLVRFRGDKSRIRGVEKSDVLFAPPLMRSLFPLLLLPLLPS